jgi:hypothetical protein
MPYCASCGSSLTDSASFCPQCGARRARPSPPPVVQYLPREFAQHTPQPAAPEQIIAVLPHVQVLNLRRELEPYTLVFTPTQTLFASLTAAILQEAMDNAQAQGKAAGRGWLGRANAQMQAKGAVHKRYYAMTAPQILSETQGNFAVNHADVASASVTLAYAPTNTDCPGDPYAAVELQTNLGALRWRVNQRVKDVVELLNKFYVGRVES